MSNDRNGAVHKKVGDRMGIPIEEDYYELGVKFEKKANELKNVTRVKACNDTALKMYKKAADKGYLPAINYMGIAYYFGKLDLENDVSKSLKYFLQAANRGFNTSIINIAKIYCQFPNLYDSNPNELTGWLDKTISKAKGDECIEKETLVKELTQLKQNHMANRIHIKEIPVNGQDACNSRAVKATTSQQWGR